jgi:hypothetical protein
MSDNRDFYSTLAQVLPVVLLTIVWDRDWLNQLSSRVRRTPTTPGVRFWIKPVVRWYSIAVAAVLIGAVSLCILVLANAIDDAIWIRALLIAATALALLTLFVRLTSGIINATR